jgi:hypothetical protein
MRATESAQGTDAADLAAHGYRRELRRSLGDFSNFAASFSSLSILALWLLNTWALLDHAYVLSLYEQQRAR